MESYICGFSLLNVGTFPPHPPINMKRESDVVLLLLNSAVLHSCIEQEMIGIQEIMLLSHLIFIIKIQDSLKSLN